MDVAVKTPTIKEVADLAGVSVQTVSMVINDKPGVTDKTRARVLAAVQTLGYRPFSVGRSLRTRKTRTLALVISDIANPSFAKMASSAEQLAHTHGYSLVVYNTQDDVAREADYIRKAIDRWIDGILFVAAQDEVDGLNTLLAANLPVVVIDRIPAGYSGPSITLDNIAAGRMAVEHLIELGHRHIAHISGPRSLRLVRERLQGFCETLDAHGLSCPPTHLGEGNWECESGYLAMQRILAAGPRPTALFAANDRMAIGAIRSAQEAGLCVPADISFVGLDDIEVSAYQNPPLTTVRQSFTDLATLGVSMLLDLIQQTTPENPQAVIRPELIVRQSTAPPPAASTHQA